MARSPQLDRKAQVLKEQGVLNPGPEEVVDERFRTEPFFDPRDLVQVKYEMIRRVETEGATVTEAARAFGFSRPTFYQARGALEEEGMAGLLPRRPGPKRAHKLTDEVMGFLDHMREEDPAIRSEEMSHHVHERFGVSVHPRSIERALARREKKRRRSQ